MIFSVEYLLVLFDILYYTARDHQIQCGAKAEGYIPPFQMRNISVE